MSSKTVQAADTSADRVLLNRIRELAADTAPLQLPPVGADESEEMLSLRKAERSFQTALCRRVWYRLSAADRNRIRGEVLADATTAIGEFILPYRCWDAVTRLLELARNTQAPEQRDDREPQPTGRNGRVVAALRQRSSTISSDERLL